MTRVTHSLTTMSAAALSQSPLTILLWTFGLVFVLAVVGAIRDIFRTRAQRRRASVDAVARPAAPITPDASVAPTVTRWSAGAPGVPHAAAAPSLPEPSRPFERPSVPMSVVPTTLRETPASEGWKTFAATHVPVEGEIGYQPPAVPSVTSAPSTVSIPVSVSSGTPRTPTAVPVAPLPEVTPVIQPADALPTPATGPVANTSPAPPVTPGVPPQAPSIPVVPMPTHSPSRSTAAAPAVMSPLPTVRAATAVPTPVVPVTGTTGGVVTPRRRSTAVLVDEYERFDDVTRLAVLGVDLAPGLRMHVSVGFSGLAWTGASESLPLSIWFESVDQDWRAIQSAAVMLRSGPAPTAPGDALAYYEHMARELAQQMNTLVFLVDDAHRIVPTIDRWSESGCSLTMSLASFRQMVSGTTLEGKFRRTTFRLEAGQIGALRELVRRLTDTTGRRRLPALT
jgi:hypothetical protein